jgi:hypothetical protein
MPGIIVMFTSRANGGACGVNYGGATKEASGNKSDETAE